MFGHIFSFSTRHQPYMARLSYVHELRSAFTFPLAASLAEGAFTGVVAAKTFNAPVVLISLITAAPMFGNIMAMVWSQLSMGRPKVRMVNWLQAGVVLMIASVALLVWLPIEWAGWVFAVQIIIARVLASGIVTIRSAIWRANYPREIRAQVTSRIAVTATTVLAATTFAGSYLLDVNPQAYVYFYPAAALLGVVGIYQFSKIRVRRELSLRRREEQLYVARPESLSQTDEANVQNYLPARSRLGWHAFFGQAMEVLREDKLFREYQRWQFISGFSFMMMMPPLLAMVSRELTDPAEQYLLATVVVQIIPLVVMLGCMQLWAPLFDRMHITSYRAVHGGISVAAHAVIFLGAMWGNGPTALGIVAMGMAIVGVAHGGGNLAWNLGHNAFASADKAATYMGVHVMLTGLRGCIAPFAGAWLYSLETVGRNIFGLSILMSLVALMGWISMSKRMRKEAPVKRRAKAKAVSRR